MSRTASMSSSQLTHTLARPPDVLTALQNIQISFSHLISILKFHVCFHHHHPPALSDLFLLSSSTSAPKNKKTKKQKKTKQDQPPKSLPPKTNQPRSPTQNDRQPRDEIDNAERPPLPPTSTPRRRPDPHKTPPPSCLLHIPPPANIEKGAAKTTEPGKGALEAPSARKHQSPKRQRPEKRRNLSHHVPGPNGKQSKTTVGRRDEAEQRLGRGVTTATALGMVLLPTQPGRHRAVHQPHLLRRPVAEFRTRLNRSKNIIPLLPSDCVDNVLLISWLSLTRHGEAQRHV
jgi:hypothetical protein